LDDLLPHIPEAVLGRRVLIASFDSGQFSPTQHELDHGWSVQGGQAVSAPVQDIADVPADGFDEWYVYDGDVPLGHHMAFVNRFGFSPLDPACLQAADFWEQVTRFQPLNVLGAGTPTMFLVTRDELIYERAVAVAGLP
jgi:hypothetical protein